MTSFKVISVICLCFISSLAFPAGNNDNTFFRNDYKYAHHAGAFFKEHDIMLNWRDAVATCKAEGATLATPASKQEVDDVIEQMNSGTTHIWIGLHDLFAEGDFMTVDGKPLADIYVNWGKGEPNDVHDNEDCVVLARDGTNNDENCAFKKKFICMKSQGLVTQNPACETYDIGYEYFAAADRCYKFHTTPRNWSDAYRTCRGEQAHLAIINSQAEADLFTQIFARHPDDSIKQNFDKSFLLLGFSDLVTPSQFITVEGKTLAQSGYEEWGSSQPDNHGDAEHCGSMFRNGKLNDYSCKRVALFLCEKALGNGAPMPSFYGTTRRAPAVSKA